MMPETLQVKYFIQVTQEVRGPKPKASLYYIWYLVLSDMNIILNLFYDVHKQFIIPPLCLYHTLIGF